MVEMFYFAMMPVIIFVLMVLYHLGYDVLEFDHDDKALLGALFVIILWPLCLAVGILLGVMWTVLTIFSVLAKLTAKGIRKSMKNE